MIFSEFANLLKRFVKNNKNDKHYIITLTNLIITDEKLNPLKNLSVRQLRNFLNGTELIKTSYAEVFTQNIEQSKFIDEINDLEEDAKNLLVQELKSFGFNTNTQTVDSFCADIFSYLLFNLAKGKNEVTPFDFQIQFDSKGNRLTGIPENQVYVRDNKIFIDEKVIELEKPKNIPVRIQKEELPYITALIEAYKDNESDEKRSNNISFNQETGTLDLPFDLKHDKERQRKSYFAAEYVNRAVRDNYEDGKNYFEKLKEDIYDGIEEKYFDDYENGYKRLKEVLSHSTTLQLENSLVKQGLIKNLERRGICHILVNDQKIKSWVHIDE